MFDSEIVWPPSVFLYAFGYGLGALGSKVSEFAVSFFYCYRIKILTRSTGYLPFRRKTNEFCYLRKEVRNVSVFFLYFLEKQT